LGHLRRCRAIAHALVDHRSDISALILSGSPIIGAYGFKKRVDFVRFPGVVKLKNGDYSSRGLDISIDDAISMRESLIRCAAMTFQPHIFLVDKEPLGLRGEVKPTLEILRRLGTRLVLGLRDIMDDQDQLAKEWDRKHVLPALESLYHDIWVYGCEAIYDPLEGLNVGAGVRAKMTYTGYLRGAAEDRPWQAWAQPQALPPRFMLVTTGGGQDGAELVDWVLRAYECDRAMPDPALVVFGPFMSVKLQADFRRRAELLKNVQVTDFVPNLECVMARATGVVAMGGYNTFCEILAADKPALIVPRKVPRLEQFIRAKRMSDLGLVRLLDDDGRRDPAAMAEAIRALARASPPSSVRVQGWLDGFDTINHAIDHWLATPVRLERQPALTP
jgi:predicted glycosyltransferase